MSDNMDEVELHNAESAMTDTSRAPGAEGDEHAGAYLDAVMEFGEKAGGWVPAYNAPFSAGWNAALAWERARAAPVPTAHERLGVELSPTPAASHAEEAIREVRAVVDDWLKCGDTTFTALVHRMSRIQRVVFETPLGRTVTPPPYTRTDERLGLLDGRVEATMEAVSRLAARVDSGLDEVRIRCLSEIEAVAGRLEERLAALEKHIHYIERHDHVGLPIMCEPAAAAAFESRANAPESPDGSPATAPPPAPGQEEQATRGQGEGRADECAGEIS